MPTRETPWPNGTPCWVDLGTPDPDGARSFYSSLLGWTYSGGEPEFGGYVMCLKDGRKAGGLGPQQDPADPSRWTTYFAADDVDATVARITEAGGTVLAPPMDVGPHGRMAIAADPQGNPFGLWQAGTTTGVEVYNEPGSLVWNEAAVDDPAGAREFYSAVFGFTWTDMPGAGGYSTFALTDRPLGGLGPVQPGLPRGWATCFSVASCDEAVAAVEAGGGKVLLAAQDTEFGRFAVVADPWGAAFSVMSELPS
ncbi:MAG: Glyoxalase/bleomycin resistance protein/dioxygenase [Modestobacter sp.]|jgi:predicted enzyme related to lactoylglutathione lyase|nr:Glyoxalase/bleomycin resistance protein/dioxygenase [Modestobacter sp.]